MTDEEKARHLNTIGARIFGALSGRDVPGDADTIIRALAAVISTFCVASGDPSSARAIAVAVIDDVLAQLSGDAA